MYKRVKVDSWIDGIFQMDALEGVGNNGKRDSKGLARGGLN